jgi:hypothetical protein
MDTMYIAIFTMTTEHPYPIHIKRKVYKQFLRATEPYESINEFVYGNTKCAACHQFTSLSELHRSVHDGIPSTGWMCYREDCPGSVHHCSVTVRFPYYRQLTTSEVIEQLPVIVNGHRPEDIHKIFDGCNQPTAMSTLLHRCYIAKRVRRRWTDHVLFKKLNDKTTQDTYNIALHT